MSAGISATALAGDQRQPDLGAAEHLAAERADGLPELERRTSSRACGQHRLQLADHRARVHARGHALGGSSRGVRAGQLPAHGRADAAADARGDRLDQVAPHRHRLASTHSARLHAGAATPGAVERGDGVEPQPATLGGLLDVAPRGVADAGVAGGTHGLAGDVGGQLGVDRARRERPRASPELGADHPACGRVEPVHPHGLERLGQLGVCRRRRPAGLLSICWKSGSSGSGDWGDSESDTRGSLAS